TLYDALKFILFYLFFFFQAEDGIRDRTVTGVQTCALPIFRSSWGLRPCALPLTTCHECSQLSAVLASRPDTTARCWSDLFNRGHHNLGARQPTRQPCFGWNKIGRASCRERV